jgi:ADP-heptose:LPS heptosyltransferase
VGVPLCFLLTIVRFLFGRSAPDCSRLPYSILFVKLAEQGSTVLAYPALRRAVEIAGRNNVYCVVLEDNRFILDTLGIIPEENVITISFANGHVHGFVRSALAAIRKLRALKLDAAIDMEFFSRGSAALTYLTGARRRVGFHPFFGAGPYRGDLMTHRLLYNPHLHTTDTFLSLVEAAALRDPQMLPTFDYLPSDRAGELPAFEPRPEEVARVKEALKTAADSPLLLLNANASDLLPLRRWASEHYVELARLLLAEYPEARVVFTGAPNEAIATAELVRKVGSDRCISMAGKTTLRELLVLYTLSRVLVTNDSGPAHFAALTPIRVVTLFGPETPTLFAARTARNCVLWAGIACSPCVSAYNNRQSPCRDNVCMQRIAVEQVFSEVCNAFRL